MPYLHSNSNNFSEDRIECGRERINGSDKAENTQKICDPDMRVLDEGRGAVGWEGSGNMTPILGNRKEDLGT